METVNLIIVEDEPAILQGIVMLVKRIGLPIVITGTYANGQEALLDLSRAKPDIVMTDVQMPVMSGLQLVEHLKNTGYPADYIILSGYAEFEYAKTALSLGVQHYLLKSPRISELRDALASLCEKIFNTRYEEKQLLFQNLLFQQPYPQDSFLKLQNLKLRIFLYTFGPLPEQLLEESHSFFRYVNKRKTLELINTFFPQSNQQIWILDTYYPNTKLILAVSPEEYDLSSRALYQTLTQEMATEALPITLTASPQSENIQTLRGAFSYAMKYLRKSIQFGKSQLLTVIPGKALSITDTLSQTERDILFKALSSQRVEPVIEAYRYLTQIWQKNSLSQAECTALTLCCLMEICRFVSKGKVSSAENVLLETASRELLQITSLAVSFRDFFDKCGQLMGNILNSSQHFSGDSQVNGIVDLLYEKILTDFSGDIDINGFARDHGYHPIYLTTQFTKIKEISPTQFIISLRLNRAKELLLSTSMSLKDVAESIGYYDVSYFSRIFKEREGVSPGIFRKKGSSRL